MWWEHYFDNALCAKIDSIVRKGKAHLEDDGRLHLNEAWPIKNHWLHVTGSTDCRTCGLWSEIIFKEFGIVHSFCRYHCWKVVTRPRNIKELIQTYNLMYVIPFVYNFINPIPGKAGLDVREYTNQPYGVFQYATNMVEALRIKEMMIHMITSYLPNDEIEGKHLQDTVIVKRSCTEFEAKIPMHEPFWKTLQTRDEWELERRLEEIFFAKPDMFAQPAWLRDKVLQDWLNHANSIGDKSIVDLVGADIFSVNSQTFTASDLQGGDAGKVKPLKREKGKATKENVKDGISNKEDRTSQTPGPERDSAA